jgi:hypothetical protein
MTMPLPVKQDELLKELETWAAKATPYQQQYSQLQNQLESQMAKLEKQAQGIQPTGTWEQQLFGKIMFFPAALFKPSSARVEAQIKQLVSKVQPQLNRSEFYTRLYTQVPSAIASEGLESPDDILKAMGADLTSSLTETELSDVKDVIYQMVQSVNRPKMQQVSPDVTGPLVPPTQGVEATPLPMKTINAMTVQEIMKYLQAGWAAQQDIVLSEQEWKDYLAKEQGYPNAEQAEVEETEETAASIVNEWKEAENQRRQATENIAKMPSYTIGPFLKELALSPVVALSEITEPYFKYVARPITGMLFKNFIPDMEAEFQRRQAEGESAWLAAGEAWEESTQGWNWAFKLGVETIFDPSTYVGFGLVGKIIKPTTKFGRFVQAAERGFHEVMDIPFDAIKAGIKRIPKTLAQRGALTEAVVLSETRAAAEQVMKVPARSITVAQFQKEMPKFIEMAIKYYRKFPDSTARLANAGRHLLAHDVLDEGAVATWASRLGVNLPREQITKELVEQVNNVFEDYFKRLPGMKTLDDVAPRLMKVLGVAPDSKMFKIARDLVKGREDDILAAAGSYAGSKNLVQALKDLGARNRQIYLNTEKSAAFLSRKQAGQVAALMSDVPPRIQRIWSNTVDKLVVKPFAAAYLTFAMYGPMNVVEDIGRSFLGGVKPGAMGATEFNFIAQGLKVDPMMYAPGMQEQIGFLSKRAGLDDQWSNWIIQGMTVGNKDWSKKVYDALVSVPGGVTMGIRRNFVARRYMQIMAEQGGETFQKLMQAGPKSIPKLGDRGIEKQLANYMKLAKTSGDPKMIRQVAELMSTKQILRREVTGILKEHPELPNEVREFILEQFDTGRLTEAQAIRRVMQEAGEQIRNKFIQSPEMASRQFRELSDRLMEFQPQTHAELADVILQMNYMQQIYGAFPHQIVAQATIRSQGLKAAERSAVVNGDLDRLLGFMDSAGVDLDKLVENMRGKFTITKERLPELGITERIATPDDLKMLQDEFDRLVKTGMSEEQAKKVIGDFGRPLAGVGTVVINSEETKLFKDELTKLALKVQEGDINLNQAIKHWFETSNNNSLQTIGKIAGNNPEYLRSIRAILKEQYPSGYIRIFRGSGKAKNKALEREFTNVTSSRNIAKDFEPWVTGKESINPAINDVLVKVDDVVAIGAVEESELIIPAKVLKDRIDNPIKDVPLTSPEWADKSTKLLNQMTVVREYAKATRVKDIEFRRQFFAGKSNKDINWNEFYQKEQELWNIYDQNMGDLQADLIIMSKEVDKTVGGKFDVPKLDISGRALAPQDVANLLGGRTDDITRSLLDISLITDRTFFTKYVTRLAKVRQQDMTAFTEDAVGQVYDQLLRGSNIEPEQVSWMTKQMMELDGVNQSLHDLQRSKLVNEADQQAIKQYTEESAKAVEELTTVRKGALPKNVQKFLDTPNDQLLTIRTPEDVAEILRARGFSDDYIFGSAKNAPMSVDEIKKALTEYTKQRGRVVAPAFKDYDEVRQKAMDEAHKWYYKEFTDYSNANAFDSMMKTVYPFWTYESQRWFWLPRSFLHHPGTWTAYNRYMEGTDGTGYVGTPIPGVEWSPVRGTIYGAMNRLARQDYPEYYDSLGPAGHVVGALDFWSRYGFYPGAHVGIPLSMFGGLESQLGEVLPALWKTPLNMLEAAAPNNEFVKVITQRIFHDRFKDYLAVQQAISSGADGVKIWTKIQNKEQLLPEEQTAWDRARQEASLYGALFEQSGALRLRPQEKKEIAEAVTGYIQQRYGYSEDQQEWLKRHGHNIWDLVGGMSPTDQAILEELGYFKYTGSTTMMLPSHQQIEANKIETAWNDIEKFVSNARTSKLQLEQQFLSGQIGPDAYSKGLGELYDQQSQYINQKEVEVPALTLEGRMEYYRKYKKVEPVMHPMKELLNLYFSIELRDSVDPVTDELYKDWDTFMAQRDVITKSIPDEYRQEWDDYIKKNQTPLEELRRQVNEQYFTKYDGLYDTVLARYSPIEQQAINEYFSLRRLRKDTARQTLIKSLTAANGNLLISDFQSNVSDAKQALRAANPTFEAWLYFWGRTTTIPTGAAGQVYSQILASVGRKG